MTKLFNRKNTVVFTVLLILSFLTASSLLIVRESYSAKAEAIIAAAEGDTDSDSNLSDTVVDFISGLLENYTDTDSEDEEQDTATTNPVVLKYNHKMKICLGFSIGLYAITLIFIGMDITCAAYDSYLQSDKYKAKLRNQRVAEKRRANMAK